MYKKGDEELERGRYGEVKMVQVAEELEVNWKGC